MLNTKEQTTPEERWVRYYIPNTQIVIVAVHQWSGEKPEIHIASFDGSPEGAELVAEALIDAARMVRGWR